VSSRCRIVDERTAAWTLLVDDAVLDATARLETDAVVVDSTQEHGAALCGTLDTELKEFCEGTLQMNDAVVARPETP
jgi:hypothetical protein